MGIFRKLFGRSDARERDQKTGKADSKTEAKSVQSQSITSAQAQSALSVRPQRAISRLSELSAHPDLRDLLWWVDGPYKNYTPEKSIQRIKVKDIVFEISLTSMQEPSLLSIQEPVTIDADPAKVERLPYYPSYSQISSEQRGVYWQFLQNPYSSSTEIGYVFILYYGLERHLLKGDYEKAFHIILKLRDIYSNKSFQVYSGNALIISSLIHNRIDLLNIFFSSLDKDYELDFSANLYLLGKFGLGLPLTSRDIMRMAKDFEFNNLNYIKKFPDIFEQMLQEQMQKSYGLAQLDINRFVGSSEYRKANKVDVLIFANISIENKTIPVPQIVDIFKLKKAIFDLLEKTHNAVKANITALRKVDGMPLAKTTSKSTPKKVLTFDESMEETLMTQYHNAGNDPIARHFSMISLQDFYYKYRNHAAKYLDACVQFCDEDLADLDHFTTVWNSQKDNRGVRIPAFQRMAIIYEKGKEYKRAIQLCDQAVFYYQGNGLFELVEDFSKRKDRLVKLLQKEKSKE